MDDHYEVLNVSPSCEDVVIRAAYRALIAKYHPDRFAGDPDHGERMSKRINEAYTVLGDPESRAAYDGLRTEPSAAAAPPGNKPRNTSAPGAAANGDPAPTAPDGGPHGRSAGAAGANQGTRGARRSPAIHVTSTREVDFVRPPEPRRRPFAHTLWLVLGLAAIPILYFHGLGTRNPAPPAAPVQTLPWSDDPEVVRARENADAMDAAAQSVERFSAIERETPAAQPPVPAILLRPARGTAGQGVEPPEPMPNGGSDEASPSAKVEPGDDGPCSLAGDDGCESVSTLAAGANPRPSFDGVSRQDRTTIEVDCIGASGIAAHNSCLREQLAALRNGNARPSFDGVSREDKTTIEVACIGASGIVAHNRCLRAQLKDLRGN